MRSAAELLRELNSVDESPGIEAKRASGAGKSVLETIIAFANEPALGGGYLLLGVERAGPGQAYHAVGVTDPDKLQADLASQCASQLNQPLRPRMRVESIDGQAVLVVFVAEVPLTDKPVYLRATGLPRGAFRRIGSTDQRCTDDDLWALRRIDEPQPGFDAKVVEDCSLDELDPDAVAEYRRLRRLVNPQAEELGYSDDDLLEALLAARRVGGVLKPTVAGVLLFGRPLTLRRLFPTAEVSYVRVVGTEWVADPERRFAATLDVRKGALLAFRQIAAAIEDDLPRGFYLPPGAMQSLQEPLVPRQAFREALANAIIHRSYRFNQPTMVVRYSDRIEFINTGCSLKPVAELGRTGPAQRNPVLAAVFRDVEIAEAKGSGIRTIRRVCEAHGCPAPEFESRREAGTFVTVLWLPVIEAVITPVPAPDTGDYPDQSHQPEPDSHQLPPDLLAQLPKPGTRPSRAHIRELIILLCRHTPLSATELAYLLGHREQKPFVRDYLTPMVRESLLTYVIPDQANHPAQRYAARNL